MPGILEDLFGRRIRLTDEGWEHIVQRHHYMATFREEISDILRVPDEIRRSNSAPATTWLYYRWYYGTSRGDKWVCVVVKRLHGEAFLVSAYVTDRIKEGEMIWPN